MLKDADAIATIAVKDLDRARKFYEETLGFSPTGDDEAGVAGYRSGKSSFMIYQSEFAGTNRATSATWVVPDAEPIVAALREKGVRFEHYDDPSTDEKDIMRAGGPLIAWFTDPAGNVFSVIQQD